MAYTNGRGERGRRKKRLCETNSRAKAANWKSIHSLLLRGFCPRTWQKTPCHLGESLRQGVRELIANSRTTFPLYHPLIFPLRCSGSSSSNSLLQAPSLQCTCCILSDHLFRTNCIRRQRHQPSRGCCPCTLRAWNLPLDLRL